MAYGTLLADTIQSSTVNSPTVFRDGNNNQIGTLCRAWVNFNGTTSPGTIRAAFNVSSVTKNGTGDYTMNFTNAMPDANYSVVLSHSQTSSLLVGDGFDTPTTTSVHIVLRQDVTNYDESYVCVDIFR